LYTSEDDGRLKPVLTTASTDTQLVCASSECDRVIYDPKSGTNRFNCDISTTCNASYDSSNWYFYVNDPRTSMINVIQITKAKPRAMYLGNQLITGNGALPIIIDGYKKDLERDFWMFAFDPAEKVNVILSNCLIANI